MFGWMIPDSPKSSHNVTIAPDSPQKPRTLPSDHIETLTADYPFILRYVNASGIACSRSPWYLFNIGTPIVPNNDIIDLQSDETIAIDWKLNVLKPIRIKMNNWYEQHPSCEENWEKLNKPISLDQCMNWFTQEEDLADELYCSECKKDEKTKKKMEIWNPPSLLIIHLKRFALYNNRWIKSNRLVNFPMKGLDPSSWLVESPAEPLAYDLYGCVNHFGRLGGGHYTAYAINKDDEKWYCFDDSCVKPIEDESTVVSPGAYLLFYQRRGLKVTDYLKGDPPNENFNIDKIVGKLPKKMENDSHDPGSLDLRVVNPIQNCTVM